MELIPGVVQSHQEMLAWRRDFHRHPEMCFQERRTAANVAKLLRSFGCDEVLEGVGGTGVVGVSTNHDGPAIALRADMDALALSDRGSHDHRSSTDGVSHACGHDGHMAMLLGAAKYLCSSRKFRGTVVFVFQPAEEIAKGALRMLDDGFFEKYGVQSVYALHSFPSLAVGRISITPGAALAGVDNFTIMVSGRGGHAGVPHLAKDPIVPMAGMISGLQTIVSRSTDPIDSVVVSITSVQSGGDMHNVIPETARLLGTVRYLSAGQNDRVELEMKRIVDGIAHAHGVSARVNYERACPPLVNTTSACDVASRVARELLGDECVIQLPPIMGGEDFAYYLRRVPGAFAFIGNGEHCASLHNAAFDFNDDALPIGASYFVRLVEVTLAQ